VSTTPAANFATIFPCVVDTSDKFATGVNYTGGKFAAGVNDTGVNGPYGILRGLGEIDL
jgi:hypothetical protein